MGKDYILARKLIQSMGNSTGNVSAENVVVNGGLDLQSALDALTARVTALDTLIVVYDANGGMGTMVDPASPYAVGATFTVLSNTFTPPAGKVFSKWNESKNGDETEFDPGTEITVPDFVRGTTLTLYAVWVDA